MPDEVHIPPKNLPVHRVGLDGEVEEPTERSLKRARAVSAARANYREAIEDSIEKIADHAMTSEPTDCCEVSRLGEGLLGDCIMDCCQRRELVVHLGPWAVDYMKGER